MPQLIGAESGPVFIVNDGGGGRRSDANMYFYLIFNTLTPDLIPSEHEQHFYRIGLDSGSPYIFVVIDIGTDARLKNFLSVSDAGVALYSEIERKCPAFVISRSNLADPTFFKSVQVIPINSYKLDVDVLFAKMGMAPVGEQRAILEFLKRANKYIEVRPKLFGIGVNLNAMLDDLITHLERRLPAEAAHSEQKF